ncbi:MAG: hypothetical protein KHW68_08990 [Lachnospiraceae bacterium]|nr:hypothetical protein [Lachnospiraceae bacterium]
MENRYLKEKYNRIRTWSRFKLGIQQLIQRPYLNIFVLLILGSFPIIKKLINAMLIQIEVTEFLFPVFKISLHIIAIICPIILLVYIIQIIGERVAIKDETNILLVFTNVKLLNQPPILISKKKDRKKGIIIREFYTNQPLHIWEEKKKDIQAKFSSTFVSKGLECGGKNHNDGKKIILYMRKGLQAEDRGTMYE